MSKGLQFLDKDGHADASASWALGRAVVLFLSWLLQRIVCFDRVVTESSFVLPLWLVDRDVLFPGL